MLKYSVAIVATFTLSACGGGGGGDADVTQSPTIQNQGITFQRTSDPSEGVRWRVWSDGERWVWFDNDLGTNESATNLQGSNIIKQNSSVRVSKGDVTKGYIITTVAPIVPSQTPTGTHSYQGNGIMRIDMRDADQNNSDTIQKFATASMTIDFGTNSGNVSVVSNDGRSRVNSNVSTYAGTWLKGSGTFTSSGDTYEDYYYNWAVGCSLVAGGCGRQTIVRSYDSISETTKLEGTLAGSNGQGATGIFMGENHAIGIALE